MAEERETTEKIVVGVDGTEAGRAALRWAARRAAETDAELHIIHVIDEGWAVIGARLAEDVQADAHQLAEKEAGLARTLAPEVTVVTGVRRGDVMRELIDESRDADLVVVGTHKTGFVSGKVFGSRSLHLAAGAHAPVAVIPQTSPRDGRGIVVGVDDSAAGRQAVRFAAKEAERTKVPLTLLRAFSIPEFRGQTEQSRTQVARYVQERTAEVVSQASALAMSLAATVGLRTHNVERPAAEALVDASASAGLVVVGSARGTDADRAMVGSVSHDVLLNMTGPTVVVHAGDRQ